MCWGDPRGGLEGSWVCGAHSKLALSVRRLLRLLRVHVSFDTATGKGSNVKGRKRRRHFVLSDDGTVTTDFEGRRRAWKISSEESGEQKPTVLTHGRCVCERLRRGAAGNQRL